MIQSGKLTSSADLSIFFSVLSFFVDFATFEFEGFFEVSRDWEEVAAASSFLLRDMLTILRGKSLLNASEQKWLHG